MKADVETVADLKAWFETLIKVDDNMPSNMERLQKGILVKCETYLDFILGDDRGMIFIGRWAWPVKFDRIDGTGLYRAKLAAPFPGPKREPPSEESVFREKYNELIMAVERKFPGESRHGTALRYIREAEMRFESATNNPIP